MRSWSPWTAGADIPNGPSLYLGSSATRFFVHYAFTEKLEAQLHVPVLYRAFRRFEGAELRERSVSGLGDVTALVGVRLAHRWPALAKASDTSGRE